jgi:Fe-S cluster biosynthesis and repair protein YggX
VDSECRAWYPTSINIEEKGTIFANGSSSENWQWSAIKTVLLNEQELNNLRFKGKTYKSDPSSLKNFGNDFLSALEYLGIEI